MNRKYKFPAAFVVASAFAILLVELRRPQLLLVGNATVDVFDDKGGQKALPGGAVSYAAAVATAYGIRACIVTAAGPDVDLSVFRGHEVHVIQSQATLTFAHSYTWWGHKRKLRVSAQPNVTLTADHIPRHCRRARTVLLGPLTPEDLDPVSLADLAPGWLDRLLGFRQNVGLMAQGLQRGLDSVGRVYPFRSPSSQLLGALQPQTTVFLSDVETEVWAPGVVSDLVEKSARWVVTKGELGADELLPGQESVFLPPYKVDAQDTNGAGDTFATAYMLAMARKSPHPGKDASWAASRAVTMPQACKPQCVTDSIRKESAWARFSSAEWLSQLKAILSCYDEHVVRLGALAGMWYDRVKASVGVKGGDM